MEPILMKPYIISSLMIDVNAAHSVRERGRELLHQPACTGFPGNVRQHPFGDTVNPAEFTTVIAIIKDPDTLFTLPEQDGMFTFPG